jgi:hypothetical protein
MSIEKLEGWSGLLVMGQTVDIQLIRMGTPPEGTGSPTCTFISRWASCGGDLALLLWRCDEDYVAGKSHFRGSRESQIEIQENQSWYV